MIDGRICEWISFFVDPFFAATRSPVGGISLLRKDANSHKSFL